MAQEEAEMAEGTVIDELPNTMFRVMLDKGGTVIAHVSGKLRKTYLRVLKGDRVLVEIAPHDTTRGRITARLRE
jgi:translation initiation factor IF-1